ncbi:DUF2190 family protein [uncultured Variovorax sp.]|uniref:DUF2190 family protein n=1 Tax=uncultured Variovorax sp. TaxID=114708 RepID=UPI0025F19913|nr:DUF2190 family protein [uncultured Variovorax sp.]
MKNYRQAGSVLTLTPSIAVASGVGYLFGAALFGIATSDVPANTPGEFKTDGVFDLGKTAGVAVSVGDRVFWDATNKVVNKTSASQECIGVAVESAAGAADVVAVKLGASLPAAT